MAFAGIFQPFARLRWIRFGLLMRDRKFSRRFSIPQTKGLAPFLLAKRTITSVECSPFLTIMVPSEDSNIDSERLAASNVLIRPYSFHSHSTALSSRVVNGRCLGAKVEERLRLRRPDSRQLCRGRFLDLRLPSTQRSLLKTN